MLVRRERSDDVAAIDDVHRRAFALGDGERAGATPADEPVEVRLVRALRTDSGFVPALSLVAEGHDGQPVAHVVGTEGAVEGTVAIGLGPLGVLPAWQRRGVGSALVHALLAAADALDYPMVVLLGHTGYYARFGFVPAASLGVTAPDPSWGAHFQARPLAAYHPALRGAFRYAAPFATL